MRTKGPTPKSRYRPRSKSTVDPFVLWCKAHGLPTPEREYRFHPERKWRFDYAWAGVTPNPLRPNDDQWVAVEVDGGVWTNGRHTRGAGFVRDMEKLNSAQLLGWTVLRYTPQQLTEPKTLADLKQALGFRKSDPSSLAAG